MSRSLPLVLLALAMMGCSNQAEIGVRYRAERDLWKTDREFRRLSIRPELVTNEQWGDVAQRYEAVASRYDDAAGSGAAVDPVVRELRVLVARALTSAARLHSMRGDTTRTIQLYKQVEERYADVPEVAAEVYFSEGGIAEIRGEFAKAAEFYEKVIANVKPVPGEATVQGAVLDLPLRIARLHRQLNPGSPQSYAAYRNAREQYQAWAGEQPNSRLAFDATARLADIAADQGDTDEAVRLLRKLESDLRNSDVPARDPAGIRFAIGIVQSKSDVTRASTRATLRSVVEDYPNSPFAPRALISLATEAGKRDADEALGYLDHIMRDYATRSPRAAARALTLRAHILEQHGRWHEALAAYRQLRVEHPFSTEALNAPLEIVKHYEESGETEEEAAALASAEQAYADFVAENPSGPLTFLARRYLYQTWAQQDRVDDAIEALESLSNEARGTRQGGAVLLDAARLAATQGDSAKAAAITERFNRIYGSDSQDEATEAKPTGNPGVGSQ